MNAALSLANVRIGASFLWKLPFFLRHPISVEQARTALRERLERREVGFLALARRTIYGNPRSPYLRLLALAGGEYGDLERLVKQEGVEGALRILYRHGVYLTVDEFKGRRPATRGNATVAVNLDLLRNTLRSRDTLVLHSADGDIGYPLTPQTLRSRGQGATIGASIVAASPPCSDLAQYHRGLGLGPERLYCPRVLSPGIPLARLILDDR